jgi:hypothetical protein
MAPPHLRRLALTGLLCLSAVFARAKEPEWPEWRKSLIDGFVSQLKEVDGAVEKHPDSPMFRSRHADLCLFLGFFPQAVSDFEKFHAMDPTQESSRWRLGIAYYFAGEYVKSEQAFEKYYEFDSHDRENGIWKFLAQAQVKGIKTAQDDMLVYKEFDREPFPILYEMYAGKKTPDEVMEPVGSTKTKRRCFSRTTTSAFTSPFWVILCGPSNSSDGRSTLPLSRTRSTCGTSRGCTGNAWSVSRPRESRVGLFRRSGALC